MRILVDGAAFENDHQRGVQRYFRELLTRVVQTESVDLFLSGPARSQLPGNCVPSYRKEFFGAHKFNIPLRAWRKLKRRVAPTRFSGHTLFHSTFFTRSPEPGLPEVVTVYDMIPERFEPEYQEWGQAHIQIKQKCLEAAKRIICISHATAADVAHFYPHLADKLCVTHLGADHFLKNIAVETSPATVTAPRPSKHEPYLLLVGDRHAYKNFGVVLKAMLERTWPAEFQLLVAGPQPTPVELQSVEKMNLKSRVEFTGPVPDKLLPQLYRGAAGFIFPSRCEGFGFPLLEAQSLSTLVICSDIEAFRETAGGATLFFDPLDPASLANAVVRLANGEAEANREAGLKNVGRFRWDQCAAQTLEIYRRVSSKI